MPLPGGPSDKYGNRYEDRWTVHCALRVLREDAEAIRLEPPPGEAEGAEFWVRYHDRIEYHQVKRQKTGEGRWTLSALSEAGVLTSFFDLLQDPKARCVFVSGHAAYALEELGDRARKATSWSEFEREALKAQTWHEEFETLLKAWGGPDPELAIEALTRIYVRVIDEDDLKTLNTLESEILLDGDLTNAVPVVTDVLRDSVGEYLTPNDLWHRLEPQGYAPSKWRGSRQVAVTVAEANRRYRESRQATLIVGQLIERREVAKLREELELHRLVLLDGPAGMGKSDALLQFTEELRECGEPYLVFRLDRLTPTRSPEALGVELGLPASPAATLSAVAQDRAGYLVIDQLDVVSTTSGRSPQFFDCISEIVRLAERTPNIRVILACRSFDVQNDARLRRLVHRPTQSPVITVGQFDRTQVQETLARLGYAEPDLSAAQANLLHVPLHLALLAEIAAVSTERRLGFDTARDLYDEFWTHKRRDVEERLGRRPAWTEVIDRLVDYMSDNQLLGAPAEIVDEWESDAEAMASSHVLIRDGRRYGFFHETFFDYVFARRFTARGRTIRELLAHDQLLFRRAQVRQVLAHERDTDERRYVGDLNYLLTDDGVRFHLKDLVASWLAQVEPRDAEWGLLEPFLDDPASPLHFRAWQTLRSLPWFRYADDRGYLSERLAADDELVDTTVTLLGHVDRVAPERVVALLRPLVGTSDGWTHRIAWVLGRTDLGRDRELFDLFLALLDRGDFDRTGLTTSDFWYVAHDLPKQHPDWACELLGHYLANRVKAADAAGVTNPFEIGSTIIPGNLHLHDYIVEAAAGAPAAFIDEIWPQMHTLIKRTAQEPRDNELQRDRIWNLRHFSDVYGDLDDHLLLGAERAFSEFARREPDRFATLVKANTESPYESVAYFLFQGLAGNPERFADAAIDFVLPDQRRFRVGYSDGYEWGTRRLIAAVSSHASDAAVARLEEALLNYYTPWERSAAGHTEFGLAQFTLLGGLAERDDRRRPRNATQSCNESSAFSRRRRQLGFRAGS
jgi:hypothetical protein